MTTPRLAAILASPALDPARRCHLRLIRAEPADAAFVTRLRSDAELNRHLNAPPTDAAGQLRWLERYKQREAADAEFYFVIIYDGADRGLVRIYDFREIDGRSSFCWGSLIVARPSVPGLFRYIATLIYGLGFETLGFDQSHFDVRRGNHKVIAFHQQSGAEEIEGTVEDRLFRFPRVAWPPFRAASADRVAPHGAVAG